MTILYVNTGSSPNKGDGDSLRTAFTKINQNFSYISTITNNTASGTLIWNSAEGTYDLALINNVTLQVGQEQHMYVKAYENIGNGQAVMFAGTSGDNVLARLYNPNVAGFKPEWFIGVATQSLTANQFGYVTVYGKVRDVNTNAFNVGNILYADNNVVGGLTATEPAPGSPHITVAAVVKKSGGNGDLMVRPSARPYLRELPDVSIANPTNGQILKYNATGGFWANVTETATVSVSVLKSIVAASTDFADFKARIAAL